MTELVLRRPAGLLSRRILLSENKTCVNLIWCCRFFERALSGCESRLRARFNLLVMVRVLVLVVQLFRVRNLVLVPVQCCTVRLCPFGLLTLWVRCRT